MDCWEILSLDATSDKREIKRAYARKLKVTHPEDDATAYQKLRDAYEQALEDADYRAEYGDPENWGDEDNSINEGSDLQLMLTPDDLLKLEESQHKKEQEEKQKQMALQASIAVIEEGQAVSNSAGLQITESELSNLQESNANRPANPSESSRTNDPIDLDDIIKRSREKELNTLNNNTSESEAEVKHQELAQRSTSSLSSADTEQEQAQSSGQITEQLPWYDDLDIEEEVDNIFKLISTQGESAAIDQFYKLVNSPACTSLDQAYELEGNLLTALFSQDPLPQKLSEVLQSHYQWRSYDNQFRYDDRYGMYYDSVVCTIVSRKKFNVLLEVHCPDYHKEVFVNTLTALYSDYNENSLKRLANQSVTKDIVSRVLSRSSHHKSLYEHEDWYVEPINAENIEWWEVNVETVDPEPSVTYVDQKQGSNTWIFWIILLMGLQVIRFCTADSGSTSTVGMRIADTQKHIAYVQEINLISDKVGPTKASEYLQPGYHSQIMKVVRLRQALEKPGLSKKERELKLKELIRLRLRLIQRKDISPTRVRPDKK